MKIGDVEYLKLRNEYMSEQYKKEPQKPNGMYGHMGWFAVKEREFEAKLRAEGKLQ
jgi:hypothetical protein